MKSDGKYSAARFNAQLVILGLDPGIHSNTLTTRTEFADRNEAWITRSSRAMTKRD